jgi:hypothetical protein
MRFVHGVRICDTPIALRLRGNHGGAPSAPCVDGGPDIAKPIADFVDTVGDWISDDRFSTKILFARSALRASGSF